MNKRMFSTTAPWRDALPRPICDAHPEYLELYEKTWELVHAHLTDIPGMPQTPYMDEAFCDTDIWIWDSCFMSLFCKYAPQLFPGVETLENFYRVLYDHQQLPTIITRNAPEWTGETIGQPAKIKIHIADNPPLFAWAEYQNALVTGDRDRIRMLLLEKQYLQKHFHWIESLKQETLPDQVRNPTCLIKHPHGFFWEGGRSGMDNTPRGRTGEHAVKHRPNNPHMLWLDALAQQGLAAQCIARLAGVIGKNALATEWEEIYQRIRRTVNDHYWSQPDGCYFDIDARDGHFYRVLTVASFWPLLAGMSSPEQGKSLCNLVRDPRKLGGPVPLVSLARDDNDFNAETGDYWRGSVWLPTAYMAIKGMEQCGEFTLARDCATRILEQQLQTYRDFVPHTIWECYHPSKPLPAHTCDDGGGLVRQDFCGWSALGPISLLIENVIGIHRLDAFTGTVDWALPATGYRIGVENLCFGEIRTTLFAQNGRITVESNAPYTLRIHGTPFAVRPGLNHFTRD